MASTRMCRIRGRMYCPGAAVKASIWGIPPATPGENDCEAHQGNTLVASLFVVTGAMQAARAENDTSSVTLYTSAIHTGVIACNAINVSKKKLTITITIIDAATGKTIPDTSNPGPQTTRPDMPEATNDVGSPTDSNEGYCVFHVSGTSNRDDVRAIQNAVLGGTRSVDGGETFFPFFITRVLEAH